MSVTYFVAMPFVRNEEGVTCMSTSRVSTSRQPRNVRTIAAGWCGFSVLRGPRRPMPIPISFYFCSILYGAFESTLAGVTIDRFPRGSMKLVIVFLAVTTNGSGSRAALPHAAEVKLFASTMATVEVVTAACPVMVANAPYLAGLRDRLHIADATGRHSPSKPTQLQRRSGKGSPKLRAGTSGARPRVGSMGQKAR